MDPRHRSEVTGLRAEVSAVRTELRLENELESELGAMNDRIDAVKDQPEDTTKPFDETLDVRERLAAVDARVAVARG